jgi:tetratricopeptide (TPR) repeat protein
MNQISKLLLLIFSVCSLSSFSQTDSTETGLMSQAAIPVKIIAAKHEFNENNMRGAITLYREVLAVDPVNATATYGVAQCYYNLKKYSLALEYLNKAVELNAEVNTSTKFFYGQIHHRVAELDKAISYYNDFIQQTKGSSYEKELALKYIKECEYAKEAMKNPASVGIANLGVEVNTRFEEYTPSITADGSRLYFTSRRSDTKGGEIDTKGDYKFFEDIYVSLYDEENNTWSTAEQLPGAVNTETYDAVLSVVPDGSGLFVYKNTVTTTGDIFFSKRNDVDNEFRLAEKMPRPINTSYFESSISMTADGNTVYFISERPEGLGQGDIYVSTKKGKSWSNPKNLGKIVNTDYDEKFVFIHPNGKTLYFASNGHQGMGSYDIFKTELVNGQWSVPVNLGYPINTVNEESTFSLTSDNKTMYISAEYGDTFGERDIYQIDVSSYDLVSQGYDTGTFGQVICTVKDKSGKIAKGVTVSIYQEGSNKVLFSEKTDKAGRIKASLAGNKTYKVLVMGEERNYEQSLTLSLRSDGETVKNIEVIMD